MLLDFWLILLPFVSSYTTDCFFVNSLFEWLYFSEYDIQMLLFDFGWEIGHPLSSYGTEKLTVPGKSNLKAQYKDLC